MGNGMYTILIVDDEKIERNGIKFLLKKQAEPFEIYEAPNGKAALEQLCSMRNQGKKIDILLTDVKMPFMDGIELIGAAKEEGFTLKTIIFSGYNEFEYAKLAVRLGVSDYILKPVNPQEFAQTIERLQGNCKSSMLKMNNVCSRAAICGNIFYIPYLMGAVQNRCIHWQEILREKISGITSTGLYFLSLTENFLGKKRLIFRRRYLKKI